MYYFRLLFFFSHLPHIHHFIFLLNWKKIELNKIENLKYVRAFMCIQYTFAYIIGHNVFAIFQIKRIAKRMNLFTHQIRPCRPVVYTPYKMYQMCIVSAMFTINMRQMWNKVENLMKLLICVNVLTDSIYIYNLYSSHLYEIGTCIITNI